jgi:hypothetical protein
LLPDIRDYDDDLGLEMIFYGCEVHNEEAYEALHKMGCLEEEMNHPIDEQTLREKLIKLIFLDIHGKSIWYKLIAYADTIWYETYYCARGNLT